MKNISQWNDLHSVIFCYDLSHSSTWDFARHRAWILLPSSTLQDFWQKHRPLNCQPFPKRKSWYNKSPNHWFSGAICYFLAACGFILPRSSKAVRVWRSAVLRSPMAKERWATRSSAWRVSLGIPVGPYWPHIWIGKRSAPWKPWLSNLRWVIFWAGSPHPTKKRC